MSDQASGRSNDMTTGTANDTRSGAAGDMASAVAGGHEAPPAWLRRLAAQTRDVDPATLVAPTRLPPDEAQLRRAAVLMLFGPDEQERLSVVLTQRSAQLRSHAGQVAFPGGRIDPSDDGPIGAALRESYEEVGLDPHSVAVVGLLPELFVPVSRSAVTTVLGWAPVPAPLWARSTLEVDAVARVPLDRLVDPAHRIVATHPAGYASPAFDLPDLYIWGFTALLLDRVLELAGLALPWDRSRERPLPERFGRPMQSRGLSGTPPTESAATESAASWAAANGSAASGSAHGASGHAPGARQ